MLAILIGANASAEDLKRNFRGIRVDQSSRVIGVDGGTETAIHAGLPVSFAIGDWDSLENPSVLDRIPHLSLKHDKSRSDLYCAALAAIETGASELLCLGVTGGRPDHHLASLLDLAEIAASQGKRVNSVMARGMDADYVFLSAKINHWEGSIPKGTLISVFSLGSKSEGVTLSGFEYPLRNAQLLPSSHGLSNVASGSKCEVSLRKGRLVIIIPREGIS